MDKNFVRYRSRGQFAHIKTIVGILVAVLRRIEGSGGRHDPAVGSTYPSLAQRVQSVDQQSLKTLLTTRFGVPSTVLENIYFFQSNRRSVSIVNAEHADLSDQAEAHGILAYTDSAVPKLTTAAVSFLGHHATASIVHLESSTR